MRQALAAAGFTTPEGHAPGIGVIASTPRGLDVHVPIPSGRGVDESCPPGAEARSRAPSPGSRRFMDSRFRLVPGFLGHVAVKAVAPAVADSL